ncbi:MAG: alpha/beta hydrolase [Eubacteriales bacterium]|nr:alpha/beta hydrolase [Eubacteriales bacterium]
MQEILLNLKGQAPNANMKLFLLPNSDEVSPSRKRPLVLIMPGGGFNFISFRESEPIALKMLSLGYHAAILDYALTPSPFPAQLLQAMQAVAHLRHNADKYFIDENKIALMGFSAGGHVAGSLGVFWSKPFYSKQLGLTAEDVKPNALILGYPVLTSGPFAHEGSIRTLAGKGSDRLMLSLELQVDSDTPPTFLFHTVGDSVVPVENSLLFAKQLKLYRVPFEMHLFQEGGHGLSLANAEVYDKDNPMIGLPFENWVKLFDAWFKRL